MATRYIDISGRKFGRLTATQFIGTSRTRQAVWKCACDCGKSHTAEARMLKCGNIQSCGCLQLNSPARAAANRKRLMTHGMTKTLTGQSWLNMLTRCFNPKHGSFKEYGARGIRPCEFIRASPLNLVLLIAERPSSKITLDRIDVNRGYTCGSCAECLANGWNLNVRWADKREQSENTRRSVMFCMDGVTLNASAWARRLGLPKNTFRNRYSEFQVPK